MFRAYSRGGKIFRAIPEVLQMFRAYSRGGKIFRAIPEVLKMFRAYSRGGKIFRAIPEVLQVFRAYSRGAPDMARLAPLLPPLMTVAAVLVAATAAAGSGDAALDGRLFNLVPRPRLQELTLADLDATLDVLTDLLEERTLPSGGKGFVSRMAAPTLYSDSALCQRHTQIYWEQFSTGAPTGWPQLMFDASGKLPDGILVGNLNVFGSRDECFLVKASLDNDTYPDLDDQELQFTGRCSSADVQTGLQSMLGDNVTVLAYTSEVADQTVDLQPADIVVITLLALVGVLLLVGTALDVWLGYRAERQADKLRMTSVVDSPNSRLPQMLHVVEPKPATMQQRKPPALATWQRVLVAFSLYTNTKKLLDTSTTLRISIWSVQNLPPTGLMLNVPDPVAAEELGDQYAYTWMRCTVWLTGIGLGYLLHRLRGRQITLKPWLWLSGWVAAFAIGISVIFGMTGYQMPWQEFSKAVAVSYGGLNRTAWGVAVGWVIFACVTGYGGPINTFLSYPGFIPLSRLTYAGYLIHINVLLLVEGSVKSTVYLDSYRYTYRLLAHVIVTFAAAMLLSLTFEVPFINLEKIMFEPKKPAVSLGGPAVAASEPKADGSEVEGTGLETDKEAGPSIKE
ncbi:Nose resistant to fluoxetine protein 6 [Amphibalanus amphitrite]|uniref:Nose resistant to fluoxetine protein 6 n=1 Tax=Amphibalanus amphitrite TaxID=1232801 RepID=A0A6A4WWQ1_AMPAM|nr:Nose resistant to fluoxetine protein 6 [Amphibalanus amphitrite]